MSKADYVNLSQNQADLAQSIQPKYQKLQQEQGCWKKFKQRVFGEADMSERVIRLDGSVSPPNYMENIIKNQKYNIITFLPVVLFNQFKLFFNLFYLLITLSQFIDVFKVGFLFSYIAPLAFVLFLTMLKEAYDDYKRYKKDKEANSYRYKVLNNAGEKVSIPSSELRVGHIVEINANERIPADILLLYTSEEIGTCFIRTDQLDGETDWKLRRAVHVTQSYYEKHKNFIGLSGEVESSAPQIDIYQYVGIFRVLEQNNQREDEVESLNLENTLWTNTVLANGKALGLVIFTGKETRSAMNSRKVATKWGIFDNEVNYLSKLIFVMMVGFSLCIVLMSGVSDDSYIQFVRYILLLSCMIPISLRVNLDFAKAIFSYRVNTDPQIAGTIARNSSIPEELGRIDYLLSDKTGTLTKNEMIFKKLSLENIQFTNEKNQEIQKILNNNCSKYDGPLSDIHQKMLNDPTFSITKSKRFRRDNEFILRDLFTALVLCHNVTPTEENGIKTYQASSPDEVALVKYADELGMKLIYRTQNELIIETPTHKRETYITLAIFPFSSETKRMGILLRHKETGKYIFYLKGADSVMQTRVKDVYRSFLLDECDAQAREGLRTLVIAQKYITEQEYLSWKVLHDNASRQLSNRSKAIREVADILEKDMDFLGITGVEDKLQDRVMETIESLRNAGIKIWMLTGDKVETAKCIAISAGLKSFRQEIYEITNITDELELHNKLLQYSNKLNTVLLIDGTCLMILLDKHQKLFFETASKAPSVICCRCLPTQKAQIAEGIKKFTGKEVAAIGDGGNDVGMIQAGDLGIGIVGKEGNQAALASDFSIYEFKYLKILILWHGRSSYKRSSVLSWFVIHRGLVISFIQLIFICIFYFVAIPIYNGWLMLGYATVYTSFPVFTLIFDEDVTVKNVLDFPQLYLTLQKGRELSVKIFLIWTAISLYQGAVIMFLSIYLFDNSFQDIITITFTSLIFSELLNVYSQLHKLHPIMILSFIGSVVTYILSIMFLNNYINISSFSVDFLVKELIITLVSWLPVHLITIIVQCVDPAEDQKISQEF